MWCSMYNRLGVRAMASNLAVIREARKIISEEARTNPNKRDSRKTFYRKILAEHKAARN